jgi:thiamine biosynthesis lipoprotein
VSSTAVAESSTSFPCFGGRVTISASVPAQDLIPLRVLLESWHRRLSRFDPRSELSLMNSDPYARVRVSPVMACFAMTAREAAERTGGLVDPTLVPEIEAAGYVAALGEPLDLAHSLALAPPRHPAAPHPERRWRDLHVDPASRTVTRPPGVMLDSGGVAKGLFADLMARRMAKAGSFAIDCCGDAVIGGRAKMARPVLVDDPFGRGEPLHEFVVHRGAVATSGIGRKSWVGAGGGPRHHLLDPSTGEPAWTGIVQATALASTAAEAEALAKAALLSGDPGWLAPNGGVLVYDDGSHEVIEPPARP